MRRTTQDNVRARRLELDNDPLWYKDAIIYELHVRAFHDSANDGMGDFRGLTREARLPAGPRRHRHLAASVLAVAMARRRIRHRGLHRRPSRIRNAPRLSGFPEGGAPARLARDHRSGDQSHVRSARVVSAIPARRARKRSGATSTSGATTPEKYKEARIIFKDFETSNWTWDPVAGAHTGIAFTRTSRI